MHVVCVVLLLLFIFVYLFVELVFLHTMLESIERIDRFQIEYIDRQRQQIHF